MVLRVRVVVVFLCSQILEYVFPSLAGHINGENYSVGAVKEVRVCAITAVCAALSVKGLGIYCFQV